MSANVTLLTHDETLRLIECAKTGDSSAMEILVERNIALVRSIAKRYMGRGAEYDDLIQIGSVGLVKAIRNFEPQFGTRFSTYAVPMVAGEIKRFLRDDGMIKVSRQLKETASKAAAASEKLAIKLGRNATIEEIAAEIELNPAEIVAAMEAVSPHSSIYEPVYGDESDSTRGDLIPDSGNMESDAVDRVLLRELLSALSSRDRKLIWLRYFCDRTQSDIAKELGISQVQVSRLESRIIAGMREAAGCALTL